MREAKRWPFIDHAWDHAWQAKDRKWPVTFINHGYPRWQQGLGPLISHADQRWVPRLPRKANWCTHDPTIRWRQKKCVAPPTPLGYFLHRNRLHDFPEAKSADDIPYFCAKIEYSSYVRPRMNCSTHGPKVFTDNQMSWMKLIIT
jgi:hypothetical protein